MRVKRFVGSPAAPLLLDHEREELKRKVEAKFPHAKRVHIVASSDGPICEVTVAKPDGGVTTHVGRVDSVVET